MVLPSVDVGSDAGTTCILIDALEDMELAEYRFKAMVDQCVLYAALVLGNGDVPSACVPGTLVENGVQINKK